MRPHARPHEPREQFDDWNSGPQNAEEFLRANGFGREDHSDVPEPDGSGDDEFNLERHLPESDKNSRPGLDELIPRDGEPFDELELERRFKNAIEGEYGGFRLEIDTVTGAPDRIAARMKIKDSDGNEIGSASRAFYRGGDGTLFVDHETLSIKLEVQGQGFGSEFGDAMEDWYKESGVDHVLLRANIDVGSYAWARKGYEFTNRDQVIEEILPRLENEIKRTYGEVDRMQRYYESMPPGAERERLEGEVRRLRQELLVAEDIKRRAHLEKDVESPGFPKPREIADLGRPEGLEASEYREREWLGKRVLLSKDKSLYWHGKKNMEVRA